MADGFFDSVRAPASRVFRGLYGAPDDPRLSAGENRNALAQGLTQGGLAMMLAGGSGPPGATRGPNDFLSLLAQGMLASKAGMMGAQANALQIQNRERMQELAQGDVSPENMGRMMMAAIGSGDVESARVLSEVLKSQLSGRRTAATRPRFINRTIDGKRYQIALDPFTGEEQYRTEIDFPVGALTVRGDVPRESGRYIDDTGTQVYNRLSGEWEPLYENAPRPRTEAEGRAEAFVPALQAAIPQVDAFDENPPVLSGEMFNNWLAGNFTPDMPRQLFTAAIPIGEAWLRQTTGAAYNPTEFRNAGLLLIPRYGDSEAVREMKRTSRHLLVAMSKRRAGLRLSDAEEEMLDNVATTYRDHLAALQGARAAYDSARQGGGDELSALEQANEAFSGAAGGNQGFQQWLRERRKNDGS